MSPDTYAFFQSYVRTESGIVLESGKEYLIEARLTPIVRREKLSGLDALCSVLRASATANLRREVVEAMTTNETLFFRDMAPFDAVRTVLLPELAKERKIQIWCSACSTGQEPYSLAMLALEAGLDSSRVEIRATDYSSQVLEKAEAGKYNQIEVNRGLPAKFLVKYFTRSGLEWCVGESVKKFVRFEQTDLRKKPRFREQFHIVFCRNVLIYFDVATKKEILRHVRDAMAPRAHLVLGAAETLVNLDCNLERRTAGTAVIYQKL